MNSLSEQVSAEIGQRVDWTRPELEEAHVLHGRGRPLEAALLLIRILRARETPRLGTTRGYVELVRSSATEEQMREARARIERTIECALVTDAHTNPITALGAETLFLGADAALCDRIGECVLAARDHWPKGPWGTTRGICELLARLMTLPECPDRPLIPLFGWLNAQIWNEWNWARTWDETLLGNSGHNWWVHTFLGFYEAGLFFPEFKGFAQFQSLAPTYFEHEISILLESDGFTRERSGYHYGTVLHFLDFLHIAEENGVRLSPEFHDRLRKGVEVFWKVLTPSGDVPYLGDSGALHRPYPSRASQENLRRLAALLNLPEARHVADALEPGWKPQSGESLLGWGRELMRDYRRVISKAPPVDTVLPASGYYFMRQHWGPDSDYLGLEAGPLGAIVHSHDHTAVFGFELYSRGRPILIDNGSGPYGDSPARLWRVGSSGHNVATVDGRDHIPMSEKFPEWRWDHTVLPFVNTWISEHRFAYFNGAHEGYRHLPERVSSCRRKIFYLRGEYWILIDRFTTETPAEHVYQIHFHVNVPCRLSEDGRLVTQGQGGNLVIAPVEGARGETVLEPCPFPLDGYDNPSHLVCTRRKSGAHIFINLLVPFLDDAAPEVRVNLLDIECDGRILSPWEATALEIVVNGRRDVYVDQHMEWNLPWRAGGCSGDGRLYHSRCR